MKKNILLVLALLFCAATAGASSAILATNALERYASSLLDDRQFAALALRGVRTQPDTQNDVLATVQTRVQQSVAFFVDAQGNTVGAGVVLSADGWLLTTQEGWKLFPGASGAGVSANAVMYRGVRYALDTTVGDSKTLGQMVHATGASGWIPAEIAYADDVLFGETLYRADGPVLIRPQTLAGYALPSQAVPVDAGNTLLLSSPSENTLLTGLPLFTEKGTLFGFSSPQDAGIASAHLMRPFVKGMLRGGQNITHAALGAYVLPDTSLTGAVKITPPLGERTGILEGSAADEAGMMDGDIILAVDNVYLTLSLGLADILATYTPEQTVTLKVTRGGEIRDMSVTLGAWDALVY